MEKTRYPYKLEQIHDFGNLEFIARQVVEGFITGLHKSPFHGFSVEFAEHRMYNTGESTRHIDWKLYGRTEKLYVKKFEEETNLRCFIVLDTSSSMLFPYNDKKNINKLMFSVVSAAALINLLQRQRDAAGLMLFSDRIDLRTRSGLTPVHLRYLFSELEKLADPGFKPLKRTTQASACLHQIAEDAHKRSLIIVFSDLLGNEPDDEVFAALRHLRHKKHDVILFHVIDHTLEKEFGFANRPTRFVDMESGQEIKLNPNEIRTGYTDHMKDYMNDIKMRCGQYQIDLVEADINSAFGEVLLPFLIKRSRLH